MSLLAALPEGLGFISCTGDLTHVVCTYLDIDTHTHTKKRDLFLEKQIFVHFVFVCGVCKYTYLCMCTRVCTGTDANVFTCSPLTFLFFFAVGPLTNLKFTNCLDWPVCRAQESLALLFQH